MLFVQASVIEIGHNHSPTPKNVKVMMMNDSSIASDIGETREIKIPPSKASKVHSIPP